ncbi:hypothetical protein [Candidatus Filomicrobium marinum]|nr:hypothetical protein [Candidatus Filomicrobium marinum]
MTLSSTSSSHSPDMTKEPRKNTDEQRTDLETEKVRDAALKRMLSTPPKPHKDEKKRKNGADGK